MTLSPDTITALPKVLLHDHLDGGLRPATMIELAAEIGHTLPSTDPEALGSWFVEAANSGSLVRYLETFEHTVAVMQTEEALHRVAKEAVLDLAADGVVYAELRYAPEQHQRQGLSLQQVVDAVHAGIADGVATAGEEGHRVEVGTLLSAMRQAENADEIAALTIANRDAGAVGFDIAGPEDGFPPSRQLSAFRTLREANMPSTAHAGEAAGVESIWEALQVCGALRLGHGVRIIEDIQIEREDEQIDATFGEVAAWVLDRQIPLEVCPCSNLQTGIADTIAEHPVSTLRDLGFAVTINTDNRLMSGTSMSNEMQRLVDEADWDLDDLEEVTLQAAWNAFAPFHVKQAMVTEQIIPGFEAARG
ncbi:adenosine deaminase [Ruania halotolerans]|uniref:adenosine deaminase n=1 Tax=Ruania halotolerans TaxID=2897773 RepID=UPI001E28A671|nr:adenosine deaminase [Ruania halotolerans]UFU05605.1 adenosine deaminase [Ruania halotolerans]